MGNKLRSFTLKSVVTAENYSELLRDILMCSCTIFRRTSILHMSMDTVTVTGKSLNDFGPVGVKFSKVFDKMYITRIREYEL